MKKTIYALLSLILLSTVAEANIPDLKFRRLDTRDGMSNSQINDIYRDAKGFVWIGTPYGLNRYDGYRFRTFFSDVKDTMTLRNNYITDIQGAFDGKLWLRQGMNYCIFDPVTERGDRHPERYLEKLGVKGGIERIYIDNKKDLWVKTYDTGFWHVNPQTKHAYQFPFGYEAQQFNSDFGVSDFAEDDHHLYVSSNNGEIICFDKKKDMIVWKNDFLRQNQYAHDQDCKLRVDWQKNLWIITMQGTYRLNTVTNKWSLSVQEVLRSWGIDNAPDEMDVWDIQYDNDHRYWIATDHGGLWVADPKDNTLRQFLTEKFDESTISENTLRVIRRDQLGRMWIGTYNNGVNLYTGALSNFVNLELGNINTVAADKQGIWWLGTNEKGIIRYNPQTQEQQVIDKENSGIRSNTMVGSLAAKDGSVWFGTYDGGLIHIKNGQVTNLTATGDTLGLNTNNIWTIFQDQWDNIWIGTLGGGVQRIDKRTGRMRTLRMSNTVLPSDYINVIRKTQRGWMLVAHSRFLSLINPKTMKVINRDIADNADEVPITEGSITALEDSRGLIWQGSTSGATIWDQKSGHVYLLDLKKGLFGSTVNDIIEDKKHTIWLATDHGISNVIPHHLKDGSWTFVVRSYNNRDGLQNSSYNQRSMCYTPDGLLLVGGQGGLDIINPDNLGKGRIKETPLFSGLQLFDQDVAVGQEIDGRIILKESLDDCREITLRYNDQFTIQLGSTSGEIHNRSRFVYRLEGFNDNWVRTSEQNPNITYNSLRAGSYTLHVRMLNDDGTFSDDESTLDITIRPPLWRTRWMILLYMLVIALSALWWRRWFIRRQVQRMKAETLRRETEKKQWMSEMRRQLMREMQEGRAEAFADNTAATSVPDKSAEQEASPNTQESSADSGEPAADTLSLTLTEESIVDTMRKTCQQFSMSPEGLKAKVSCRSLTDELRGLIDNRQLSEAINILLTNSVRFSPGNCQITVNIGRGSNDHAIIQVADNGLGIRDEYKATAFQPMLGAEGIGLDRVHQIITAHGGTIRLEDNPGGGTIFTISLPALPEVQVEDAVMMDD